MYLTREWIVTFRTSLRNFFDTVFTYLHILSASIICLPIFYRDTIQDTNTQDINLVDKPILYINSDLMCVILNSCSPKPALLNFESEHTRIQAFTAENNNLHDQLARTKEALARAENQIQQLGARFAQQTFAAVSVDAASSSAARRASK